MDPNDPRHGTKAGRSQHYRDGEEACTGCKDADNIAGRRRRKRKAQGAIYRREVGTALHGRLVAMRERGATYQAIADAAGVSYHQVYRAINEGPNHRVNASTWLRLHGASEPHVVTLIGLTRRIQALQRLGYSMPRICTEVGMTLNGIKPLRDGTARGAINRDHSAAIVDLYERWQLVLPTTSTTAERKSVTRARNHAEHNGWPPPLAWDDIDNPDETPTGWEYKPPSRLDVLTELDERGAGISEVCHRLGLSRDSLQKWCSNHGLSALFLRLGDREVRSTNQHDSMTREARVA